MNVAAAAAALELRFSLGQENVAGDLYVPRRIKIERRKKNMNTFLTAH